MCFVDMLDEGKVGTEICYLQKSFFTKILIFFINEFISVFVCTLKNGFSPFLF